MRDLGPHAPVAAAFLGILALLVLAENGEAPSVWLPLALVLLAVAAVVLYARPGLLRALPRSTSVALTALAALAAWSYASILWAEAKGSAWDGANRVVLYALVFAVLAVWPWSARAAACVLGAFSVGVAAAGLGSVAYAQRLDRPETAFIDRLLVEPLGYHNATAALFLVAFWPAVYLGSRREVPPVLRALLVGTAAALLCLAIPAQSRGALIVFPFATFAFLVLAPGRARLLLVLAVVGAVALAASGPLLDVYDRAGEDAGEALRMARDAVAAAFVGAGLAGGVLALVDRRLTLQPSVARVLYRTAVGVAAIAVAVGVVAALPPDPLDRARERWEEFKVGEAPDTGGSHFTSSLGSNRYDFWRVGLGEFRDRPLLGVGADNFAAPYVRKRQSDEEPLYPHSLEVQVLSQTGVVGALLAAAFLLAAGLAVVRARRLPSTFAAGVAATGVAAATYWFGHASGDWLWEFPAVTCAAVGLLGLAGGLAREEVRGTNELPRPARLVLVGAAVLVAGSLALPWLAAKEVDAAARTWRSDLQGAYDRLARARALNPLSERADLVEGAIASRRRDWERMRAAFTRALERNPGSWYAEFELAVAYAVEGRRSSALQHLDRAQRLNPREPALAVLRRRVRREAPIDPAEFDRLFLERVEERTS